MILSCGAWDLKPKVTGLQTLLMRCFALRSIFTPNLKALASLLDSHLAQEVRGVLHICSFIPVLLRVCRAVLWPILADDSCGIQTFQRSTRNNLTLGRDTSRSKL